MDATDDKAACSTSRFEACPFCGSEVVVQHRPMQVAIGNRWLVRCNGCEAHGPIAYGALDAVTAWNTRWLPADGRIPVTFRTADLPRHKPNVPDFHEHDLADDDE